MRKIGKFKIITKNPSQWIKGYVAGWNDLLKGIKALKKKSAKK